MQGIVLGALLGGVVGNLTDRFIREPGGLQGHVIDYIQVWGFPAIFNVADMCIVATAVLVMLGVIRELLAERRRGGATRDDRSDPDTA